MCARLKKENNDKNINKFCQTAAEAAMSKDKFTGVGGGCYGSGTIKHGRRVSVHKLANNNCRDSIVVVGEVKEEDKCGKLGGKTTASQPL